MTVPTYLPYYVIVGSAGIIVAILVGLRLALARAHWPASERATAVRTAALMLIGWFAVAAMLAGLGIYRGVPDRVPIIQFGIVVPILIGGWLIWRSRVVARIIETVPQHWLVGVQLYRALGVVFLVLYASDRLPGLFAWPAGLGDVLVGLMAPIVALAYAQNPRVQAGSVLAWNTFGLADLAVAVATGVVTSPSVLQLFAFDKPNELISAFPLVLVPTFLVPVSVLLHVASLTKLRREGLGRVRHGTIAITSP